MSHCYKFKNAVSYSPDYINALLIHKECIMMLKWQNDHIINEEKHNVPIYVEILWLKANDESVIYSVKVFCYRLCR